jgi:drug/metabolite transporter (DMT)-like permease
VGLSRWGAALAGFLGVVLIVKPGAGDLGFSAYIVLLALACTTVRDVTTRGLPRDIPSMFVAAASSAAIVPAGFLVAPLEGPWLAPSAWAWTMLAVSGFLFFGANTLIISALRTGEIAVVAPFRYVAAPFAVVLGYFWWGEVPDALACSGISIVVAAGLYTPAPRAHAPRRQTRRGTRANGGGMSAALQAGSLHRRRASGVACTRQSVW